LYFPVFIRFHLFQGIMKVQQQQVSTALNLLVQLGEFNPKPYPRLDIPRSGKSKSIGPVTRHATWQRRPAPGTVLQPPLVTFLPGYTI